MAKVVVAVSAYNEVKAIVNVINDLKRYGYKNIIVIDDGSQDATSKLAKANGVKVVRHAVNLGRGATLKTGIDAALAEGADIIVTSDGDGQHQAKDIAALIKPILTKKVDVVLGSRFLKRNKEIPFTRKFLLSGSLLVERALTGLKTTDVHNGFRAMSRKAAENIDIKVNDRAHCTEIIQEIKKRELKFMEVPVDILYDERTLKSGLYFAAIKVLARMILNRFVD